MFHVLMKRLAEQMRLRREIAKVRGFDDHLLADMGIPRQDIACYVREGR